MIEATAGMGHMSENLTKQTVFDRAEWGRPYRFTSTHGHGANTAIIAMLRAMLSGEEVVERC